jgi:hypothetical protein
VVMLACCVVDVREASLKTRKRVGRFVYTSIAPPARRKLEPTNCLVQPAVLVAAEIALPTFSPL